jgi:ribosomal protein S18 acetylase RimI-like enzyme
VLPNGQDGRVRLLRLTEEGRKTAAAIDRASDEEAEVILAGIDAEGARELVGHLRAAERILEGRGERKPIIDRVEGGPAVETVRVLMREYAAFLGVDLGFQGFEDELAELPGKYAPPTGALFLVSMPAGSGSIGAEPAGCVALRDLGGGVCEMKRLFVRPEYRGYGLGRSLAECSIAAAQKLGYGRMRLDTLESLESAVALYRTLGFTRIPPYCANPLPGAMFWEKRLS